jgi:hypothetical protein
MRSVQCENHTAYKFAILILGLFGRNTFLLEKIFWDLFPYGTHVFFFNVSIIIKIIENVRGVE